MIRALFAMAAFAAALALPQGARAEATSLRVAKQFGVAYMQFMIMEDQKMIEKQAKAAGLGDITVEFNQFRSSDVMNDALISRNLDFACLGLPGLITIWSKTRGNYDVRAASGLNVLPLILNVRDPAIQSCTRACRGARSRGRPPRRPCRRRPSRTGRGSRPPCPSPPRRRRR